jgi:hypothetical protein
MGIADPYAAGGRLKIAVKVIDGQHRDIQRTTLSLCEGNSGAEENEVGRHCEDGERFHEAPANPWFQQGTMARKPSRGEASLPQSSRSSRPSTVRNTRGHTLAFRHPPLPRREPCGRLTVTGQSAWRPDPERPQPQERPAQPCVAPPAEAARTCWIHDACLAWQVEEQADQAISGPGAPPRSVPAAASSPLQDGLAPPPQAAQGALPIERQTSWQDPTIAQRLAPPLTVSGR